MHIFVGKYNLTTLSREGSCEAFRGRVFLCRSTSEGVLPPVRHQFGEETDFSAACKKPAIPAGFCCLIRCCLFARLREVFFFAFPGDGCRGESGSVSAPFHPPEKSALGKDGGLGGKEALVRQPRGFLPPQKTNRGQAEPGAKGGELQSSPKARAFL